MIPEIVCLHHILHTAVSYDLSYPNPILTTLSKDLEASYSFKKEPIDIRCLAPLELRGRKPPQIYHYATWLQVV